jgi:hypothetical protein
VILNRHDIIFVKNIHIFRVNFARQMKTSSLQKELISSPKRKVLIYFATFILFSYVLFTFTPTQHPLFKSIEGNRVQEEQTLHSLGLKALTFLTFTSTGNVPIFLNIETQDQEPWVKYQIKAERNEPSINVQVTSGSNMLKIEIKSDTMYYSNAAVLIEVGIPLRKLETRIDLPFGSLTWRNVSHHKNFSVLNVKHLNILGQIFTDSIEFSAGNIDIWYASSQKIIVKNSVLNVKNLFADLVYIQDVNFTTSHATLEKIIVKSNEQT